MSVKMRQHVERQIARRVIYDAIKAGYALNINIGDENDELPKPSTDAKTILAALMVADEERLVFYKEGKRVGWVYFVYGNSGWDVISDYTINLEALMEGANNLADRYGD